MPFAALVNGSFTASEGQLAPKASPNRSIVSKNPCSVAPLSGPFRPSSRRLPCRALRVTALWLNEGNVSRIVQQVAPELTATGSALPGQPFLSDG